MKTYSLLSSVSGRPVKSPPGGAVAADDVDPVVTHGAVQGVLRRPLPPDHRRTDLANAHAVGALSLRRMVRANWSGSTGRLVHQTSTA